MSTHGQAKDARPSKSRRVSRENKLAQQAAYREGVQAERERIIAIVGHPEADGRMELAVHIALATSMTHQQALEALKAAPRLSPSPQVH